MAEQSIVHYNVAPLGDWYYHTSCGTYSSDEWVTQKTSEVTCDACVAALEKGNDERV